MTAEVQTLTQRLATGRLPLSETLRFALQIIDALRRVHDTGRCHGALTPDAVVMSGAEVELLTAPPGAVEALTPYTAPERLKGLGPDNRSDIFALGAILYEMITGQPAFTGADEEDLANSIENATPAPLGDVALDRLIANCLMKEPASRWQRVQQVHMEIKILTFSASRERAAAMPRVSDPALQGEIRQLESRLSERLGQHAEGLSQHGERLGEQEGRNAHQLERLGRQEESIAALQLVAVEQSSVLHTASQTLAEIQNRMEALQEEIASSNERATRAEQASGASSEGARREAVELQVSLAGELHSIELTVKDHSAAIESIRAAMARTDDFMERVVEALESLQTMVLEQANK